MLTHTSDNNNHYESINTFATINEFACKAFFFNSTLQIPNAKL